MERLWSYLRRFAKSTKEMRPSHRIDVLTSALSHYAWKVRLNLGMFSNHILIIRAYFSPLETSLCKRLKHAREVKVQAQSELSRLIESSNGKYIRMCVMDFNIDPKRSCYGGCATRIGRETAKPF